MKTINNIENLRKIKLMNGGHSRSHILKNLKSFMFKIKANGYYLIEDIGFQENVTHKNDIKKELSVINILRKVREKKLFKSKIFSVDDQIRVMSIIEEVKIFKGEMKKNKSLISIIVFIKIRDKNYIIKSKNFILKPMELKNININFINKINSSEINKFTQIKNKKQTYKSCLDYLITRFRNNELYYSINTLNGRFFGTLTMREISDGKAYLGILIFDKKFQGTLEAKASTNVFLDYCFKKLDLKAILGVTYKKNIGANFYMIINNFKMIKKYDDQWEFSVNRNNFKKYYDYKLL